MKYILRYYTGESYLYFVARTGDGCKFAKSICDAFIFMNAIAAKTIAKNCGLEIIRA